MTAPAEPSQGDETPDPPPTDPQPTALAAAAAGSGIIALATVRRGVRTRFRD